MTSSISPAAQPYTLSVWKVWLSFLVVLTLSISGVAAVQKTSQADQQIDFSSQLHLLTFGSTQESLRLQNRDNATHLTAFEGPQDQPELAVWRHFIAVHFSERNQRAAASTNVFVWQTAPYQLPVTRAPPSSHV